MFKSAKEMIIAIIENEGKVLKDAYGRQWKYDDYTFYFKDIGTDDKFEPDTIKCLHLYQTNMYFA